MVTKVKPTRRAVTAKPSARKQAAKVKSAVLQPRLLNITAKRPPRRTADKPAPVDLVQAIRAIRTTQELADYLLAASKRMSEGALAEPEARAVIRASSEITQQSPI